MTHTDFIRRRMSTELLALEAAAGLDMKLLRALDRAHRKWEARYPEVYEKWWRGVMEAFAHKMSGRFKIDTPPPPPTLKLIRS